MNKEERRVEKDKIIKKYIEKISLEILNDPTSPGSSFEKAPKEVLLSQEDFDEIAEDVERKTNQEISIYRENNGYIWEIV